MKRLSCILTLILLSLSSPPLWSLDITADISGSAVHTHMNGEKVIQPQLELYVDIYADNDDIVRLGWSSPFRFTGTDDIQHILPLDDDSNFVTPEFTAIWEMAIFTATESWDGDLSTPDQWSFTGLSIAGWNPGGGEILAFRIPLMIDEPFDVSRGQFCIDSGNFTNDTYDWIFEAPSPGFEKTCWEIESTSCGVPYFENCPDTISGRCDEILSHDLQPCDICDDPMTCHLLSGPGEVDSLTGIWSYQPDCDEIGTYQVEVCVIDPWYTCPTGNECTFTVEVLDASPVISGDCNETFTVAADNTEQAFFTVDDNDTGDILTWSVASVIPMMPVGEWNITDGILSFTPDPADARTCFTFEVRVTDTAGNYDECSVHFCVVTEIPFEIMIEKAEDVYQGCHRLLDVTKTDGQEELWGFDFLIGYDISALAFTGAVPGDIFDIPGDYEWEYFTYRYDYNGDCGDDCPTGLVRVVALADQNDGAHHPLSMIIPDEMVLFKLDFLVTNDRNYSCTFVPVNFYWNDCGDNTVAFRYRVDVPELVIRTGLASRVFHHCCDATTDPPYCCEITDFSYGFPGWFGPHESCFECPEPDNPDICPVPFLHLYGGGVDIICADDIDDRGDINLNGIANEIADALIFTDYFIYGLAAFTINVEGQIAATEVNGDGVPLTLGDLVFLIRIICGDAIPYPKETAPIKIDMITCETISIGTEIGAALFIFDGCVELTKADGASEMELKYDHVDGETRALLYSFEKDVTAIGDLIHYEGCGELIKTEFVDYYGRPIQATAVDIQDEILVPIDFGIKSYPNPFNQSANIELSLPEATEWNLEIYNSLGQRLARYSGRAKTAGRYTVGFDAAGLASGIYFCKLTAGDRTLTEKMILAK